MKLWFQDCNSSLTNDNKWIQDKYPNSIGQDIPFDTLSLVNTLSNFLAIRLNRYIIFMLIQYTGLTASMSGALMPDLSFLKWLLSASEISRRSHRQLIRPHNSVTSFCMSSFCSSSWNSQQNTTYQVRNHSVDWIASLTIKYPQPLWSLTNLLHRFHENRIQLMGWVKHRVGNERVFFVCVWILLVACYHITL